nr:hypothetical protein Iba_chr02dCG1090 [Ipomoea batatas]
MIVFLMMKLWEAGQGGGDDDWLKHVKQLTGCGGVGEGVEEMGLWSHGKRALVGGLSAPGPPSVAAGSRRLASRNISSGTRSLLLSASASFYFHLSGPETEFPG